MSSPHDEPLYRLPTYSRAARQAVLLTMLGALAGDIGAALMVATQHLAAALDYHRLLGEPMVLLPSYPHRPALALAAAAVLLVPGLALLRRSVAPLLALPLLVPLLLSAYAPLYPPIGYFRWTAQLEGVAAFSPALQAAELVLLGSLAAFALATVAAMMPRLRSLRRTGDVHGSGRFASAADILASGLVTRRPGIVLGAVTLPDGSRRYLCDAKDHHVFVYAPPGAGKTTALMVPTLLTWPGSVVVLDIKGELWDLTSGFRSRDLGQHTIRFDPVDRAGGSARYNPLAMIERGRADVQGAQRLAELLINPDGAELAGDPFWRNSAQQLLVGLFLDCLYAGPKRTLDACAYRLADPSTPIVPLLQRILTTEHDPALEHGFRDPTGRLTATQPVAAAAARMVLDMHERTRAGVVAQALSALQLFFDPILAANCEESDFRAEDLLHADRPVSLYLVITIEDLPRLRPVFRAIVSQILRRLTARIEIDRTTLRPRGRHEVLLLLDELPQLGRYDLLELALGLIRSFGVRAAIAVQAMSQITKLYGPHQSLSSNCRTQVAYTAADLETAKVISALSGTRTVSVERETKQGGVLSLLPGRASHHLTDNARPVLTIDEARRLPADRCVIFATGSPPILAERAPFYEDPILRERAAAAPPTETHRLRHGLGDWSDQPNRALPAAQPPVSDEPTDVSIGLADELPAI